MTGAWPSITAETKSLGWALVELIERDLYVPTGIDAGVPMRLTDEQVDLIVAWYEVDERGAWRYRRGAWRLPKKWGKSPLAAAVAYCELVGPVVFDHFDDDGDPVGRCHPSPRIQIAAVSEDNTDNTYLQLYEMLRRSPAVEDRGLDVGLTRITIKGEPGIIEPVTASADSREGNPVTFVVMDETHLWTTTNGGKKLAATIRRNAAPLGYRTLETTNAFAPGVLSVAETTHQAAAKIEGILYVAREAPKVDVSDRDAIDRDVLVAALLVAYGDSAKSRGGWTDIENIADEFYDPANDLADMCRFYLNQIVAPTEAIVDLVQWSQLVRADAHLVLGDTIALGFDGSDTGDATALVACRWPDFLVVVLGLWEPGLNCDKVDRTEVDAVLRRAMADYRVVRGYFDPPQWQTEIDGWTAEFGKAVMRFPHASDQRIGEATERFATMVKERTVGHLGDPELVRHLANGRRAACGSSTKGWWRPARQHQGRPIDLASAAIGAVHALGDAVAKGEAAVTSVEPWAISQ